MLPDDGLTQRQADSLAWPAWLVRVADAKGHKCPAPLVMGHEQALIAGPHIHSGTDSLDGQLDQVTRMGAAHRLRQLLRHRLAQPVAAAVDGRQVIAQPMRRQGDVAGAGSWHDLGQGVMQQV